MIYVLTNQKSIVPSPNYKFCTKQNIIDYLEKTKEDLCIDTETTGFDPHQDKLLSIQLGDEYDQYVIDCSSDIRWLKSYLEERLLVGQNLKFDLKFLYKQEIYPRKLYDTFTAERVINNGDKTVRAGLDHLTERYLGITLDKSVRTDISKEGLSDRVIVYAAKDIQYLTEIKYKQTLSLIEKDLEGQMNVENRFTPCLAYIEYCGFKLDIKKWQEKMDKDNIRLIESEDKLNDWVMKKGMNKFIIQQLDLFSVQKCSINWASPKQCIPIMEEIGVDCTVFEKGVKKKSVESTVIGKYEKTHELVKLYLEYKKASKVVGTYGQNFIDQINPATGRLHTKYTQVMDTFRISSGGKDRITKEEFINFQNIPKDKETRACFVSEKGNTLVIADYSGQEQIILANNCLDPNILEFYDKGLADMHSFIASKMFPELDGLSVEEIKENHSEKRYESKIAGFAINYGGVGQTIAEQLNKPLEDGERVYNAYFTAFPKLKDYFDRVKKLGVKNGFILINDITRGKTFLPFYNKFKELADELTPDFWRDYRIAKDHNTIDYPYMKSVVRDYYSYKGEIERMSLNYPIQGTAATVTKISCVYIFDWICEHKLFDIVKFVNTIHDENILECPDSMSEEIKRVVEESMAAAGDIFCKRVPLVAKGEITNYWKK